MDSSSPAEAEVELIRKWQAGDHQAFAQVMRQHKEKAVQIVYMTTGNYEDAKDIAQEAFIKAHKAIRRFDGRAKFSTWFYRILINASKDHLRKKHIRKTVSFTTEQKHDYFLEAVPDPSRGADDRAVREETQKLIKKCIGILPEKQRQMFTLRFIEGLSIAEICEVMDAAEGTVKSSLHFAAEKFKAAFQPYS